jgi:K+-transporting ATPase ATPase B chain
LRANVITKSGKAVETAGDIDVLLLDKTELSPLETEKRPRFYPKRNIRRGFYQICRFEFVIDNAPDGSVELAGIEVTNQSI